mgnify:FL=1
MATYVVPGSIDDTGTTDVTSALQSWIASLPDGSPASPTIVQFGAAKTYRVESTLTILLRNWLTFDWNGSTLVCDTTGTLTRSHIKISRCTGIRVTDLIIDGPNDNAGTGDAAYVAALEVQHAFEVVSSTTTTIDNCTVAKIYGDWVYLGMTGSYGWADGVLVENCTFTSNGRQGFGFVACRNVEVRYNTTTQCRRSLIDLEPNSQAGGCDNIWFHHNTFGSHRLSFIASKGYPASVDNVLVEDNTCVTQTSVICMPPSPGTRRNWTIRNNTVTNTHSSGGSAAWYFVWVDGLTVTGNVQHVSGVDKYLCRLVDCTSISISGNTMSPALGQYYEVNSTGPGTDPTPDPAGVALSTPKVIGGGTSTGFQTSISVTLPQGSREGDIAIGFVGHAGTVFADLLPSGWTIIDQQASQPGYAVSGRQLIAQRFLTAADITANKLTFTFNEGGSSSYRSLASIVVIRGAAARPPDAVETYRSGAYKSFLTIPGPTTSLPNALVLWFAAGETGNAIVTTSHADLTKITGGQNNAAGGFGIYVGSVVYAGAGEGADRTFTIGTLASVYGVALAFVVDPSLNPWRTMSAADFATWHSAFKTTNSYPIAGRNAATGVVQSLSVGPTTDYTTAHTVDSTDVRFLVKQSDFTTLPGKASAAPRRNSNGTVNTVDSLADQTALDALSPAPQEAVP